MSKLRAVTIFFGGWCVAKMLQLAIGGMAAITIP